MRLSLETLQALAACNPFQWDRVPWNEKNERIEAAGLLPYLTHGHNPHHVTSVTRAVLGRLAEESPTEAEQVLTYAHEGVRQGEEYSERAVFEWVDMIVAERKREALSAIAGEPSSREVARRVM